MGTTTIPQQQNPQTGADKDPCEVLLTMLYLSYLSLPLMSAKLSTKKTLINHKFSKTK